MDKKKRKWFGFSKPWKEDFESYTKKLVTKIVGHAIIWVYLSYGLAFVGKEQIAEALSIEVVRVIIGTVLGYLGKALVENIFKHWNHKPVEDIDILDSEEERAEG